jgi:hypothetical protein
MGNIHRFLLPLRQAMYDFIGLDEVEECYADYIEDKVVWVDEIVKADS